MVTGPLWDLWVQIITYSDLGRMCKFNHTRKLNSEIKFCMEIIWRKWRHLPVPTVIIIISDFFLFQKSLEQKRNNLQRQHDDAKALKESIDKRKSQVTTFLKRSLDDHEFEGFDTYINIKLRLIMEVSDIEDQVTHCEEQISAIEAVSS